MILIPFSPFNIKAEETKTPISFLYPNFLFFLKILKPYYKMVSYSTPNLRV